MPRSEHGQHLRVNTLSHLDAHLPLRDRACTAWDETQAARFLASDDVAFIAGGALPVFGGKSAQVD